MKTQSKVCAVVLTFGVGCSSSSHNEIGPKDAGARMPDATRAERWTTAVTPKPLGSTAEKALAWLVAHQQDDGGWAQGEETMSMRTSDGAPVDRSNVADTCVAALSLVRAGSTPAKGRHATQMRRAVEFVCSEIEAADDDSLYVTSVRNTRVQAKIGQYVDTFAASMLLPEVKGRMGSTKDDGRVDAALAKVLKKIARHQKQDGGWEGQGWATVLSQSLGGKGINRAMQSGAYVDDALLERSEKRAASAPSGNVAGESAGVALYAFSGTAGNAQDFMNTGYVRERDLKLRFDAAKDEGERKQLDGELKEIASDRAALADQQKGLLARVDDPQFVAGFGSNGGEEFLSYMNISESLVVRADDVWKRWDDAMSANLARVQNEDGSWTGHHCITGRTFCTSAAVLVLLADRAPVPVEVVAARR